MKAADFLKQHHIEDRIINREDLPEYWKSISQLMEEYKALYQPPGGSLPLEALEAEMKDLPKLKDFASGHGDAQGYAMLCGQEVLLERLIGAQKQVCLVCGESRFYSEANTGNRMCYGGHKQ